MNFKLPIFLLKKEVMKSLPKRFQSTVKWKPIWVFND